MKPGEYDFHDAYEENLFSSRYQDRGEPDWYAVADRTAQAVAPDWDTRARYAKAMSQGMWLPSSPQLWNFGSERHDCRAGSSCYTLRIEDNLESFEQADIDARKIYVASGGAGFLFNACRPRGVGIKHSVSACVGVMGMGGPLRRLEARTGYVTNGGRERGAMMAQLSLTHPDVIEFLLAKRPVWIGQGEPDKSQGFNWMLPLQNCNMSVRANTCFMQAVEHDMPWVFSWFGGEADRPMETVVDHEKVSARAVVYASDGTIQIWPVDNTEYKRGFVITTWEALKKNLKPNPRNFKDTDYGFFYNHVILKAIQNFHGKIMAREVMHLISTNAWTSGDPGMVFEDTYAEWHPTPSEGERLSNPCAEYVNGPGGSCLLLSQNLRYFAHQAMVELRDDHHQDMATAEESFMDDLAESAAQACRYINDALNHCRAPVDYIEETTRERVRTVGQGMMGLAEAMMLFGYDYASEDGRNFAARCMDEIAVSSWEQSFKLHRKDASRYPAPKAWDAEKMRTIFRKRGLMSQNNAHRWRDLHDRAVLGERATNTTVTCVAPTGSISMISGWLMSRLFEEDLTVTSGCEPPFSKIVGRQDNSGQTTIYHDLADNENFRSANELSVDQHVLIQAAIQQFVCMAVSKTINLPESATVDDVHLAYTEAWKHGIPATALYRDNSKPFSVLTGLAECPSGECEITPRSEG